MNSLNVDTTKPLMPKASAMWLIENTALTFEQIGVFCGLHVFEVESIANKGGIMPKSPIKEGLLAQEEIDRCQNDPEARLNPVKRKDIPAPRKRAKGPRYTPVSKRGDKPDGIAFILKFHPEISDAQIVKLIGTTKKTIESIRTRSHANMQNIRPRNPADLGLCTYEELDNAYRKALKAQGKDPDEVKRQKQEQVMKEQEEESAEKTGSGFDFSNFLGTGSGGSGF